jgi:hypothetical protein
MPVPEWWSSNHTEEAEGKICHGRLAATYYCLLCQLTATTDGKYFEMSLAVSDGETGDREEAYRIDAESLWASAGYDEMRNLVKNQAQAELEKLAG